MGTMKRGWIQCKGEERYAMEAFADFFMQRSASHGDGQSRVSRQRGRCNGPDLKLCRGCRRCCGRYYRGSAAGTLGKVEEGYR